MGARFDGNLHLPGEPGYDRGRTTWRQGVEHQPWLVAEVSGPADVARAVIAAREWDVPIAVQSTGHGALRSVDSGVLLTLRGLTQVHVDPQRAEARVGGGARWADVLAAAARYGLAPVSGSAPEVGVAGYTLGGGLGWLSRRCGFAAESLLSAEVITTAGRRLTAGPDADADLWWALRGGGGNFGVVTELRLRLHPVSEVFGGVAYFPGERAVDIVACHRDQAAWWPDELATTLALLRVPDLPQVPEPIRGRVVVALRVCHTGPVAAGRRALAPLLHVAGPPLLGGYAPMAWPETALLGEGSVGTQVEHTDLVRVPSDDLIELLVAEMSDERAPGPSRSPISVIELRHLGGALARPGPESGAVGFRREAYALVAAAPRAPHAHLPEVRDHLEAFARRLRPYVTGGALLNFLTDPRRTATAFGAPDLRRLAALKRVYDPEDVLRPDHHIVPGP